MPGAQFTVANETGFYVAVADGQVTVYESYDDAIAEIQDKLATDSGGFLAQVAIDTDDDEDIAVTLEQVSWQQVIRDLGSVNGGS